MGGHREPGDIYSVVCMQYEGMRSADPPTSRPNCQFLPFRQLIKKTAYLPTLTWSRANYKPPSVAYMYSHKCGLSMFTRHSCPWKNECRIWHSGPVHQLAMSSLDLAWLRNCPRFHCVPLYPELARPPFPASCGRYPIPVQCVRLFQMSEHNPRPGCRCNLILGRPRHSPAFGLATSPVSNRTARRHMQINQHTIG